MIKGNLGGWINKIIINHNKNKKEVLFMHNQTRLNGKKVDYEITMPNICSFPSDALSMELMGLNLHSKKRSKRKIWIEAFVRYFERLTNN